MKKYFSCLLLSLFFFIINAYANNTIIISAPAPTLYAQIDNNQLIGPSIEVLKLLFAEYDVEVKTKPLPWARAIMYIKSGKIDAIAPIFYSEERAQFIEFTTPFDTNATRVFVKKDQKKAINTWHDLANLSGLTVRGRSQGKKFDDFARVNLNIEPVNSLRTIILRVVKGRGDFGIGKHNDIILEAKKACVNDEIKILSLTIAVNENLIGFSKKSPYTKYIPSINKHIKKLRRDGTIEKIVSEYLQSIRPE